MKTVYLDYDKARSYLIDRIKLLDEYDIENKYSVMVGMPICICVEGSYIKLDDLANVCRKEDAYAINKYISSFKYQQATPLFDFKWRRSDV